MSTVSRPFAPAVAGLMAGEAACAGLGKAAQNNPVMATTRKTRRRPIQIRRIFMFIAPIFGMRLVTTELFGGCGGWLGYDFGRRRTEANHMLDRGDLGKEAYQRARRFKLAHNP